MAFKYIREVIVGARYHSVHFCEPCTPFVRPFFAFVIYGLRFRCPGRGSRMCRDKSFPAHRACLFCRPVVSFTGYSHADHQGQVAERCAFCT